MLHGEIVALGGPTRFGIDLPTHDPRAEEPGERVEEPEPRAGEPKPRAGEPKPRGDEPEQAAGDPAQARAGYDDVTVVATAMKLRGAARAALSDQLGPGYIVVDMQSAPATTDVLLVPPVSPQLIGHLRSAFPGARIVAAEFEDEALGISYLGAIRRMLDAGAETYLASSTIPQLARQLDRIVTERPQLTGGSAPLEIRPLDRVATERTPPTGDSAPLEIRPLDQVATERTPPTGGAARREIEPPRTD